MADFFFIVHPPRTTGDPFAEMVTLRVERKPEKDLHAYFREHSLNGLRSHCRVTSDKQTAPLRMTYVPQVGDVIRMNRVKSLS